MRLFFNTVYRPWPKGTTFTISSEASYPANSTVWMDGAKPYPLPSMVQREDLSILSEIVPLVVKPQPPSSHLNHFFALTQVANLMLVDHAPSHFPVLHSGQKHLPVHGTKRQLVRVCHGDTMNWSIFPKPQNPVRVGPTLLSRSSQPSPKGIISASQCFIPPSFRTPSRIRQ